MHRELEWPVSKATCSYRSLYTMYRILYTIIEGTRLTCGSKLEVSRDAVKAGEEQLVSGAAEQSKY